MEAAASLYYTNLHNFSPSLSFNNNNPSKVVFANHHRPNYNFKLKRKPSGCVALGSGSGSVSIAEEDAEWLKIDKECKEKRGIVEVLECLEKEAIMGDDQGKEPIDYNRRAHIFDKSSQVFQALKDQQQQQPNNITS